MYIIIPSTETNIEHIFWTGWEANQNGKLVPQLADMSKVMDPQMYDFGNDGYRYRDRT